MDLVLNNQQWLICNKTKPNQTGHLSISLFVFPVSASHCWDLFMSLHPLLSISPIPSLSFLICHSLSLSLTLLVCISLSTSVSVCLSVCLSSSFSLSPPLSLSLMFSFPLPFLILIFDLPYFHLSYSPLYCISSIPYILPHPTLSLSLSLSLSLFLSLSSCPVYILSLHCFPSFTLCSLSFSL